MCSNVFFSCLYSLWGYSTTRGQCGCMSMIVVEVSVDACVCLECMIAA